MMANPDIKLKSGLNEAVVFVRVNYSVVGSVGPLIKDERGILQDCARTYLTLSSWILRQTKRFLGMEEKYDYSKIQTVDWMIGACILMTRDAYQRTAGLDEHYFLYADDLDLFTRIRASGLEVVHFPKIEVEYEGTRSALHSRKYTIIFLKSNWYYWKKFGFFSEQPKRKKMVFD